MNTTSGLALGSRHYDRSYMIANFQESPIQPQFSTVRCITGRSTVHVLSFTMLANFHARPHVLLNCERTAGTLFPFPLFPTTSKNSSSSICHTSDTPSGGSRHFVN